MEAVEKTRAAVVTVQVEKRLANGRFRQDEGTGVVVDERGYIVTCRHVIHDSIWVKVLLIDGTELAAELVAEEPRFDLAILRAVSKKTLKSVLFLPDADPVMVGETVIAIGHPYGYRHTVSTGIVSGLNREIPIGDGVVLKNLIQTDAGINAGNSGGPLLNINGELLGINCAYRDGARGIAFAVNSTDVKRMLSDHMGAGRVAVIRQRPKDSEGVSAAGSRR